MRMILGTSRGLWLSFSLHMSPFSRCHPTAIRWQRPNCLTSLRSSPLMFGTALGPIRLSHCLVDLDLRRRYRGPLLCRVSAPQPLGLWTTSPGARALGMSFSSTIGLSTCLNSSCLKRGLLRGGTCGWRSTVFGREHLRTVMGMWFG
jgi:hypothetical protein